MPECVIDKESVLEKIRKIDKVSGCAAYDCDEVENIILNETEIDVVTLEDHERMKRELNTEIEGLKKAKDIILARNFATNVCQETLIERAKDEAIKEVTEGLKSKKTTAISCDLFEEVVRLSDVESIINEMVGDTK